MRRTFLFFVPAIAGCFSPAPAIGAQDGSSSGSSSSSSDSGATSTSTATSSSGESTASPDASSDTSGVGESDTSSDASTGEVARCDPDATFAEPTLLVELDTDAHEDHAWLSHDELVVYVSSNRSGGVGGYDIYTAARDEIDAPFGELTLLTGSSAEDRRPTLTSDRLTLFVASSPIGALSYDIMVATRDSVLVEFGALAPVALVNSEAGDSAPWISPDGATLWFDSHRDGSGDLFHTARVGEGSFALPVSAADLNTPSEEATPVLAEDGLTIWFASNRVGGVGDYDVWTSTRASPDDDFGPATNLAEVSSTSIDWPTWISPDGCRLYLGSRRPDGGDYDLWLAAR